MLPMLGSVTNLMNFTMNLFRIPLAFVGALLGLSASTLGVEVDFNREVRPIIANHCLKCHGVDDKARKGNLRLDLRNSAMGAAKSGEHAIVPGKPDQSAWFDAFSRMILMS